MNAPVPTSPTPSSELPPPASLLAHISTAVWVFDIDRGRVHWANPAALEIWRADSLDELCGRDMATDMSASVARRLRQYQQDFERGPQRFVEQWTLYPKGVARTLRVVFSAYRLDDGRMAMLCEAVGEQLGEPESLRGVDALLHTSVMISLHGRDGRVLYRNPAAREALAADDAHDIFVSTTDYQTLRDELERRGDSRIVAEVWTRAGARWHEVSARRCHDTVSGGDAFLLSAVDVSELKHTEARAHFLAHHDTLTGLPNRNFVLHAFQDRLELLGRQGQAAALLFIDLDRFKTINDSLGHAAGDELLIQMARRLRALIREGDLVARLGGDEFLLLAPMPAGTDEALPLAGRILDSLSMSVQLRPTEVTVTPSIGVSFFPRDGDDIDTLMRHADVAMYRVKDDGRNGVACFTPELGHEVRSRLSLEQDLRGALRRGELELHYQPRLDIARHQVIGAEALVRWRHPQRGLLQPGEFIPVCEDAGLMHELSLHVLRSAARQQAAWARDGLDLQVSVNLSPRNFNDPALPGQLRDIVAESGCRPQAIELEITESVLLGHDQHTIALLEEIGAMGFRIAIDDFGTGYSNLAYLQRYPIHTLKIDRSFVHGIGATTPLTEMIIAMCRMLKLRMVAEGVEQASQLAWLSERGVQEFQGFLYAPPLPVADFVARVTATG